MPSKVRVFVSSTMDDLANERQAVVEQVRGLGLEPVNAEGLLPSGETSWNLLADEIRTSHIFVLILGDRYGWIPATGHGAGLGKSVTHLETDLAREAGLPILPFVRKLRYGTDSTGDDAVRRDRFRSEMGNWSEGMFRTDFELAIDLGQKVRQALLDVFQDTYLKRSVRSVEAARSPVPASVPPDAVHFARESPPLASAVLFAGAGFSIAAGYPTAGAFAEVLGQRLKLRSSGLAILARHSIADVAALAEARIGREGVVDALKELLDTPFPVGPTRAHFAAVQAFSVIITTNYDLLFERACELLGLDFLVHTPVSLDPGRRAAITIYKIDGSIHDPDTLVLTEDDHLRVYADNTFWTSVESALNTGRVVVVGHSMRDVTSRRLFAKRNLNLPGVYVSPLLDELDAVLLHRYRLKGIKADADTYMTSMLGPGAARGASSRS